MVPVAIDTVVGRTGNVAALWRYFRRDDQLRAGWGEAARLLAAESRPLPTWVTGPRPVGLFAEARTAPAGWLLLAVAALGAALLAARRRADHRAEHLVWVTGSALLAGLVAAAQLRGIRFHYLVYWRAPIIAMVAVAAAVGLAPLLTTPLRRWAPAIAGLAAIAATAAALAAPQVTRHGREVGDLLARIDPAAVPDGPVLVRLADTGFVGAGPAVVRWLEHRDVRVGVDPAVGWVFGDRTLAAAEAREVWYVTDSGWALSLLGELPGARVLATRTPLSPAEEDRLVALHRSLAGQLRTAGFGDDVVSLDSGLVALALREVPGIGLAELEELAAFNERLGEPGARFGVVAFAPGEAPELPWPLRGF